MTLSQCTVRDQCCICVIAKILILLYLFCSSHCGIPDTSISYHAEETDSILRLNYQAPADSRVKCILGCGEEESIHFIKTFDSLRKEILALNDLPLTINSIQGTDPAFRMTEVMSSFGLNKLFFLIRQCCHYLLDDLLDCKLHMKRLPPRYIYAFIPLNFMEAHFI